MNRRKPGHPSKHDEPSERLVGEAVYKPRTLREIENGVPLTLGFKNASGTRARDAESHVWTLPKSLPASEEAETEATYRVLVGMREWQRDVYRRWNGRNRIRRLRGQPPDPQIGFFPNDIRRTTDDELRATARTMAQHLLERARKESWYSA